MIDCASRRMTSGDTVSYTNDAKHAEQQRWVGGLEAQMQGIQETLQEWRKDFRRVGDKVAKQEVGMAEIAQSLNSLRDHVVRYEQESADKAEVALLLQRIDRNTEDLRSAQEATSEQASSINRLEADKKDLDRQVKELKETQKKAFRWGGSIIGMIVVAALSGFFTRGAPQGSGPKPAAMQVSSSPSSVAISSVSSVAPHSPNSDGLKIIGDLLKGLIPK